MTYQRPNNDSLIILAKIYGAFTLLDIILGNSHVSIHSALIKTQVGINSL